MNDNNKTVLTEDEIRGLFPFSEKVGAATIDVARAVESAVLAKLGGMPADEWLKEHERLARAFGGAEYDDGYADGDGVQDLKPAGKRSSDARDALYAHARARILPAASEAGPIEFDGTDAEHPAWWRGHYYTTRILCERIAAIMDGKDDGAGVSSQPWEGVRRRLLAMVDASEAAAATFHAGPSACPTCRQWEALGRPVGSTLDPCSHHCTYEPVDTSSEAGAVPVPWRDINRAIYAVDREAARRGEMYPQTSDEQDDDRKAVRRVMGMVEWYATKGGAVAERLDDWPKMNAAIPAQPNAAKGARLTAHRFNPNAKPEKQAAQTVAWHVNDKALGKTFITQSAHAAGLAIQDGGTARPLIYGDAAPPAPIQQAGADAVGHVSRDASVAHMRVNLPEGTPECIYLQISNDDADEQPVVRFQDLGEVTWCEDQIGSADPEYIRADMVQRLLADERRKARAELIAEMRAAVADKPMERAVIERFIPNQERT